MKYGVLVVDNESLISEMFAELLRLKNTNYKTYVANTAAQAFAILSLHRIDVAVVDARMPQTSGIELLNIIKIKHPQVKRIGMTGFGKAQTMHELMNTKPHGLLLKSSLETSELQHCIDSVLGGNIYIQAAAQGVLDQKEVTNAVPALQFTKRELELIELLSIGKSSKEIADLLALSLVTIEGYRKDMLQKANCKNSAQLITLALENGLI